MTDNHAKRNVIQHRQLVLSKTMNPSPAFPVVPESSASTSIAMLNATPSQNLAENDVDSGRNKTMSKLPAEQSSAIVKMAADFNATMESWKPYLEAKVKRNKLSHLKELEELGVVDEDELKTEAKNLV